MLIDDLEQKAKAASEYIAAANPQTVLKLIAVVRAAKMVLEPRQLPAESPMHDLPSHTALKKALAALENENG